MMDLIIYELAVALLAISRTISDSDTSYATMLSYISTAFGTPQYNTFVVDGFFELDAESDNDTDEDDGYDEADREQHPTEYPMQLPARISRIRRQSIVREKAHRSFEGSHLTISTSMLPVNLSNFVLNILHVLTLGFRLENLSRTHAFYFKCDAGFVRYWGHRS